MGAGRTTRESSYTRRPSRTCRRSATNWPSFGHSCRNAGRSGKTMKIEDLRARRVMSIWLQIRVWVHQLLRHRPIDSSPAGDQAVIMNCSCGGYVQSRWEGSTWVAEYATCPLGLAKLNKLPSALVK